MGCGLLPMPHVFTPVNMASGRVGGTKSLKSGKVGDTVLGIVQESDGSYAQKVSAYVPTKAQTQTVKLAVQQMCTGMVEAMMKQLKPLASVGFQSAVNKSKSLNAFSSYNLMLLAREAKDYWDEVHEFEFAYKGERIRTGGRYILSSGSLQYNCFDGYFAYPFPDSWIDPLVIPGRMHFGIFFLMPPVGWTIGQFMDRLKLTYSTEIWIAQYSTNQDEDVEGEYVWCRVTINHNVRQSDPANEENIQALFEYHSNKWGLGQFSRPSEHAPSRKYAYCIGFRWESDIQNYIPVLGKAFTVTYVNGRKMISSARLDYLNIDHDIEWGYWRFPADCVSSWTNPRIPAPVPYPY